MLKAYVSVRSEVDIEIIIPYRKNMEKLLKQVQIGFGGKRLCI